MRKVNIEKKVDLALSEIFEAYMLLQKDDETVCVQLARFKVANAISYLCMLDDYVVEEKSTYYCLSEIERNVNNYLEEREKIADENGNQ